MKKFIVISLLAALTLPTFACGWYGTDNYYMFSPYTGQCFKDRVEKICNDNWKAYIGDTSDNDWYSFHDEDVLKAARQKGDALMVSYVENLQKYLKCVGVERDKQYEWDYPTKEEIAAQQRDLKAVRTYAQGKTNSKLRSQHALLFMRCNMMLGQHQENITFWEKTASQFIETVYKDMMKNIYAGALYKTGREAEAGQLFAEMNDYESLMTMYYLKRSYQAISQHYKQNPTSKALPWLLTDFVNNAQEAADAENGGGGGSVGKQFIRDINKQESWQMQQFCEMVVKEGKTDCPIMWKMAKAWLEFLSGKKKEAVDDILAAAKLDGTARMKDNAHALLLYITASQAKPGQAFDDYVADELVWLRGKQEEHEWGDLFFDNVENRLTNQVLVPHYRSNPVRLAAVATALHSSGSGFDLDTLNVASTEKFLYYVSAPANTKLDKFLKSNIHLNDTAMSDMIGTKYMRLCQWDKAIQWLNTVPISYYNEHRGKEYLYYSLVRQWDVEPWAKRQWLDSSQAWEREHKWWKHRKLDFCKEVQMMENSLNMLNGKALEQSSYNLAVRYAQASIYGDCWWLLRDYKSCWDSVRVNEVDMAQKAVKLLQKAAMSSDQSLKRKALFALGYRELYNDVKGMKYWMEWRWVEGESTQIYHRDSPQFLAFQALYDETGDQPQEDYIRKCDEYEVFRKYYRQHR